MSEQGHEAEGQLELPGLVRAQAKEAKRKAEAKAKAGTAYKLCNGLAKRVKEGEVAKATAIATIKATLGDVTAPPECK